MAVLIALGFLWQPLVLAHGVAIVLVVEAFAMRRRAALWRLALAIATSAAAAGSGVPIGEAAVQIPFVYGISAVVIALAETIRRSRGALERLALYDSLTGLPNRVLFAERLQRALDAPAQPAGLALLLLDLDRFKEVNDTFGHAMGDRLLKQVAERFGHALRGSDLIARLGGDEFALLLPDTDAPRASHLAERLLDFLERPFQIDDQAVAIGASIGIALAPQHGTDSQTLLQHADVAMYVAKRSKGSFAVYDRSQDENASANVSLLAHLREAISAGRLSLDYQPQIESSADQPVAVEALVRWQDPDRGWVPPSEFIPLAERGGLIRALTDWVLRAAIDQGVRWRDDGLPIPIAVNLSMRDLLDPRFPESVARLLARSDLSPELLALEITESALMADERVAATNVARLRALRIRVSIDDFGTGYSSLAYLDRLRADEVKIDRSFVRGLLTDESSGAIVRATIDLAHTLHFEVVAEGVEDEATWRRLALLGCDRLQGYAIARPLPPTEAAEWLRQHGVGLASTVAVRRRQRSVFPAR
jgi:diguanylate cyclase (GGDEF)-like protein